MTNTVRRSTATEGVTPPRPGPVSSWKLSEPVRLYLYGVGSIVLLGLVLAGAITQDWQAYGLAALAEVLAVVPATEAARASVWSTRSLIRELARVGGGAR